MILGMITCLIVGVVVCFIGFVNVKGDISTLHSYHRQRVAEADIKPFGRLVGIGTIIIGASVMIFGVAMPLAEFLNMEFIMWIGETLMFLGLAVGISISVYAIKKYNGGLF